MAVQLRHDSPFLGCRFDPEGRFVFAGAQDSSIVRWQLDGQRKTLLVGHRSWVRGLAFHAQQKKLFSGDYAGKILVWQYDADTPTPLRTIDAHRGWVRALAVSPDGRTLASCGNDHLVKIWSTADFSLVRELRGHEHHVYNVTFHPNGTHLASADLRGVVKDWDLSNGTAVRTLDAGVLFRYDNTFRADIGGARGMAFNGDGSLLACSGITDVSNAFAGIGKAAIVLFNWATGQRQLLLRPQDSFQGTCWGVAFHSAGFLVAAGGGGNGALWFLRPNQPQAFHTVAVPSSARDVALHPDGRRIAVPCFDNSVRIYDIAG